MSTQMVVPFPDSLGKQIPEHVFTVVESAFRSLKGEYNLCFVTLNQQIEKRVYNVGEKSTPNIYYGIPGAVRIDKEFSEVLNMFTDDNFSVINSVIEFEHRAKNDLSLITILRMHAVLLHPDRPMIAKYYTWQHKGFDKTRSCDIYHPDFNWDRC